MLRINSHRAYLLRATLLPNQSIKCTTTPASRVCSTGASAAYSGTFKLALKCQTSPDSWILRFNLPDGRKHLGNDPMLPTCISARYNGTSELGEEKVLKKSYSPISHPSVDGFFDLLVKGYEIRPGGGVGTYLNSLNVGQKLVAGLKAERIIHGSTVVSRRWKRIGLVAGGTGVAPLIQIIRICLENPTDQTRIQLLSINRRGEDILMKNELDRLASNHPDRFSVTYSLTSETRPGSFEWETGRGSVEMVRRNLPPPAGGDGSTMIFVCGMDEFVATWGGPVGRAPPKADGTKGPKIQGPLAGLLKEADFDESEVFKY